MAEADGVPGRRSNAVKRAGPALLLVTGLALAACGGGVVAGGR